MLDASCRLHAIYALGKEMPVSAGKGRQDQHECVKLVPDAFNMRSQRVAVALDGKQNQLWDVIYDTFGGTVAREKIDGFKAAAGTVLHFYNKSVVEGMQEQFPRHAESFTIWAQQANGTLQLSI